MNNTMTMVNLTPHAITLPGGEIPPSGQVARVAVEYTETGEEVLGAAIVRAEYGQVTDLPAPQPGTIYIVSALVRAACPDRRDLASPARLVRDDAGRIIGASALEVS